MSVSIISSYVTCITLPTFFFQYNCTFLISKHNFVICTWFHDYIWMAMYYFCAWLYRFFSLIVLSNKVAGFKRGCQTFNNIHGGVFVVCYFWWINYRKVVWAGHHLSYRFEGFFSIFQITKVISDLKFILHMVIDLL